MTDPFIAFLAFASFSIGFMAIAVAISVLFPYQY